MKGNHNYRGADTFSGPIAYAQKCACQAEAFADPELTPE
jgi:hypothetical protein